MIAPGTVEERIEELKQEKRELFSTVVGDIPDMTDWTRHFSSLDALIRLSDSPAASASAEAAARGARDRRLSLSGRSGRTRGRRSP